jgi:alkanesulfonate monooxygenase SsuD/methylene tetrahydromethanopterin reductase-like flavin-dependent oxidoreductase (luciferase family)
MVAIIGVQPARFRPLIELYREAGRRAGHPPDHLKVGLHCIGFVGDTTQQAADDFYPGWAQMFGKIGKERGFGPPVRAQYDATCAPDGAYLIGDPQTVATKILRINDDLGGISRISLQMTNVRLAHQNLLRGIELLGTGVAPLVREAMAS